MTLGSSREGRGAACTPLAPQEHTGLSQSSATVTAGRPHSPWKHRPRVPSWKQPKATSVSHGPLSLHMHRGSTSPPSPSLPLPTLHTHCAPPKGTNNLSVLLIPLPWLRMFLLTLADLRPVHPSRLRANASQLRAGALQPAIVPLGTPYPACHPSQSAPLSPGAAPRRAQACPPPEEENC